MERLTGRYDGQAILICENEKCDKFDEIVCCSAAHPCEAEQNMIDRLAAYEDAEEAGLLVRLPCKVGDKVRDKIADYIFTIQTVELGHKAGTLCWIPVTERLPEKSGDYLVFDNLGNLYVNEWHCLLKKWQYYDRGITHWMPLPKPPWEG